MKYSDRGTWDSTGKSIWSRSEAAVTVRTTTVCSETFGNVVVADVGVPRSSVPHPLRCFTVPPAWRETLGGDGEPKKNPRFRFLILGPNGSNSSSACSTRDTFFTKRETCFATLLWTPKIAMPLEPRASILGETTFIF